MGETRNDIASLLTEWFDKGIFKTVESVGVSSNIIDCMSQKKQLTYTPINKVVFVGDGRGDATYEKFMSLYEEKRILTTLTAKVYKDCRSLYHLHKAAKQGDLLRFKYGKLILYID